MSSFVQGLVQKVVASVRLGGGLAPDFPYETDRLLAGAADSGGGLWSIYAGHAVKKASGVEESVTIFIHDLSSSQQLSLLAARNAIRRLKTMRHPCILRFIGSAETDRQIMFATERVEPLVGMLTDRQQSAGADIPWRIHRLQRAIEFIHAQARVVHGNLRIASLFCTAAGELKLGGFELACELKDEDFLLFEHAKIFPNADPRCWPSEINTVGGAASLSKIRAQPFAAIDVYMAARLLAEICPKSSALPPEIVTFIQRASSQDARQRPSIASLSGARAYFAQSPVIELDGGIEEIHGVTPERREYLLSRILECASALPHAFLAHKVAPALQSLLTQSPAAPGITAIRLLFACAKIMDEGQFEQFATPIICFLFQKPDRGIRMALLDLLPEVADRLPVKAVQDKIYSCFVSGFTDAIPALRDATLKASILLAPRLTPRQLNTELLRFYARLQSDEQSGIRVNTLVCLGRIARLLDLPTCHKVLPPALVNALRDPFGPSRMAALSVIKSCQDLLGPEDVARALLPAICPLIIDSEADLRSTSLSTVEWLLARLKQHGPSTSGAALDAHHASSRDSGRSEVDSKRSSLPPPQTDKARQLAGWSGPSPSARSDPSAPARGARPGGGSRITQAHQSVRSSSGGASAARQTAAPRKSLVAPLVRSVHGVSSGGISADWPTVPAEAPLDGWGDVSDLDLDSPTAADDKHDEGPAVNNRPSATETQFSPIAMEDPWS